MTFIRTNIQDGFLYRSGWRGRFITAYYHKYGGPSERTERYHSHPWKFAISVIFHGEFDDDIEMRAVKKRRAISFAVYTKNTRHRITRSKSGTKSLFFGFMRNQETSRCADVKVSEGYCHYSEISGDVNERA